MTVNMHKNFMKGENSSYINDNLDKTPSFEVRAEGNYSHSTETIGLLYQEQVFTMSVYLYNARSIVPMSYRHLYTLNSHTLCAL